MEQKDQPYARAAQKRARKGLEFINPAMSERAAQISRQVWTQHRKIFQTCKNTE